MPLAKAEKHGHRYPWAKWFTGSDGGTEAVIGRRMVLTYGVDFFAQPATFMGMLRNKATAYGVGIHIKPAPLGVKLTVTICAKRTNQGRPKSVEGNGSR